MPQQLTILYTHNIRGQFHRLPRVASALKRLKRAASGSVLVLDAGDACAAISPLCRQTQGRAAAIMLDAIGYDAANVTGYIVPPARTKLGENYLRMALVDEQHSFSDDTFAYAAAPEPGKVHIPLATADNVHITAVGALTLAKLDGGQIGEVVMRVVASSAQVQHIHIHDSSDAPPDATIAGTLEFIESEARQYRMRHADDLHNE